MYAGGGLKTTQTHTVKGNIVLWILIYTCAEGIRVSYFKHPLLCKNSTVKDCSALKRVNFTMDKINKVNKIK